MEQTIVCPKCGERIPISKALFDKELAAVTKRLEQQALEAVEDAARKIEADHRQRELQLQKQLDDAKRQAADLKRRLEQAPQPVQGEVAQLNLGDMLKRQFPTDSITQIRKGVRGGDVLQKVYSPTGQHCGTILWESKNTKDWSNGWLMKLRADQRREKAEIAVLASTELPRSIPHFGQVEGVWVTGFPLAPCLALALRTHLIQLAGVREAAQGNRDEQMQLLYDYLASTEFRQRIEAIVESFRAMQDDLNGERTAMERYWSKRETHLQVVVKNVAGMYGDMQAIVSLPSIRRLELPA